MEQTETAAEGGGTGIDTVQQQVSGENVTKGDGQQQAAAAEQRSKPYPYVYTSVREETAKGALGYVQSETLAVLDYIIGACHTDAWNVVQQVERAIWMSNEPRAAFYYFLARYVPVLNPAEPFAFRASPEDRNLRVEAERGINEFKQRIEHHRNPSAFDRLRWAYQYVTDSGVASRPYRLFVLLERLYPFTAPTVEYTDPAFSAPVDHLEQQIVVDLREVDNVCRDTNPKRRNHQAATVLALLQDKDPELQAVMLTRALERLYQGGRQDEAIFRTPTEETSRPPNTQRRNCPNPLCSDPDCPADKIGRLMAEAGVSLDEAIRRVIGGNLAD
jgi:hypothetical protein